MSTNRAGTFVPALSFCASVQTQFTQISIGHNLGIY